MEATCIPQTGRLKTTVKSGFFNTSHRKYPIIACGMRDVLSAQSNLHCVSRKYLLFVRNVDMGDEEYERNQIVSEWHTTFKKGTDFDMWGQPVEAVDTYTR